MAGRILTLRQVVVGASLPAVEPVLPARREERCKSPRVRKLLAGAGRLEAGAARGDLSRLMKGETLPARASWEGILARSGEGKG